MSEPSLSSIRKNLDSASSKKSYPSPPASVAKDPEQSQLSRAMALGSYFVSGLFAINASQFLGAPLYLLNEDWYNAWIAFTKESWGLLIATMTQHWAPTIVRVSGDKSVRGQILQSNEGDLLCKFPSRLILIANHQIYTDWLYLWWIGYTAGMHGHIFIILKESLKRIPVIGWGMQFYQFIFLKRNWELDKPRLALHMQKLNKPTDPMWLMMFPEGTNLAPSTREASKKWADKNGLHDMRFQLLPRSTGLQFCLQNLCKTVDYVYDCTIAYEGVPIGEYAQDIFTVQGSYLDGQPPASVNMYWRRFRVDSIPIDKPALFDRWLRDRWTEKDMLLSVYHRTGRFPADTGFYKGTDGKIHRGAGYIESEVKSVRWYEFLKIFAPVGLFAMVLYMFYGAIPKEVVPSTDKQFRDDIITTMQKGLAEKSRQTAIALPNEGSSKVKKDIFTAATRKAAIPLSDRPNAKFKAENSPLGTRKSTRLLPNKSNAKANTDDSISARKTAISLPKKASTKVNADTSLSTSRKAASSLPDKTSSKTKICNSLSTTGRTTSSITSKSSNNTYPDGSSKENRKTATSLPGNSTSKLKVANSVTATKKPPPKLATLGTEARKSKNEKPALRGLASQKKSAHFAAHETAPGEHKSQMPINRKVTANTQQAKTSSSSQSFKNPVPQASTKATSKLSQPKQAPKKTAPKLPQPKPQSQFNKKQVESRAGEDSAPKTLRSQKIKPKSAVKRPSNIAVSESIRPVQSKN